MEYRILDNQIKNKGRAADAIGVIFGVGIQRRLYILDLFGYGRHALMYDVNYFVKDVLRIFMTNYTYSLGTHLRSTIKHTIEFYVNI
jgi:hypothetical protein